MLIKFNTLRNRVLFIHENGYEYKGLMDFPAFLKEGPHHYLPAKAHIVFNVVSRIQTAFKKISIDKDVYDFMSAEMKLLPLPGDFKFLTKPLPFQEIALRYMYTVGSGGLLLDPGMGKSKVTLDFIALMKFKKTLLICPKPLLFVWEDEVATHRKDLTIHVVETTDWAEEWEKGKDKNIFCMNYSKAAMLKDEIKKQKFDFIHLDEFLIKDPSTIRTQSITEISKGIPHRCGGSGTLINNSILDVFAPIRYLEPGLVGWNYNNFKNRHTIRNPRDLKMVVGYTKAAEARSVLESCCIVMTKEEWLKLPPKNVHDIYVNLSEEQRAFYKSLQSNYIAQIDDMYVEIDNALVMMSKLYQVSNGFVYISEKDDEELDELLADVTKKKKKKTNRKTIFFKEQPKINALLKLIGPGGRAHGKRSIIWFNMEAEFQLISQALEKEGYKFLTIKGGDKNIGKKVREFNMNPNYDFLVCQAKSVNYGITVLGTTMEKLEDADFEIFPGISPEVHTEIFYSCNFSLEVYLQQQDRIHRIGQTKDCDYYRIFANTSVDQKVRTALDDKLFIRKDMLVDIAEKLKETPSFVV